MTKEELKEILDWLKQERQEHADDENQALSNSITDPTITNAENLDQTKIVIDILKAFDQLSSDYQKLTLDYLMKNFDKNHVCLEENETDYLSLTETAKVLGCTPRTLHNWIRNGKLKGEKYNNRWFFKKEDIIKHMK